MEGIVGLCSASRFQRCFRGVPTLGSAINLVVCGRGKRVAAPQAETDREARARAHGFGYIVKDLDGGRLLRVETLVNRSRQDFLANTSRMN